MNLLRHRTTRCTTADAQTVQSQRRLSCRLLVGIIATIIGTSACSGGGNAEEGGYEAQLRSAQEAIRPRATEWAAKAADVFLGQFQTNGKTSYVDAIRELEPDTTKLNEFVCQQFDGRDELTNPDRALDVERDVPRVVEEATMTALAHYPQLLYEIGMTTWGQWPPFTFKDPAPPPDTPVEGLPDSLRQYVKPEFIDVQGGLKLPGPGDPTYEDFRQWYGFDPKGDNRLWERSRVTTAPTREHTSDCLSELESK